MVNCVPAVGDPAWATSVAECWSAVMTVATAASDPPACTVELAEDVVATPESPNGSALTTAWNAVSNGDSVVAAPDGAAEAADSAAGVVPILSLIHI